MRELIIRCDRCGGLIEGDPITLATESRKDKWMLPAEQHPDLCKDCADQVVKWIYKREQIDAGTIEAGETEELNIDGKAVKLCYQQADEAPEEEEEEPKKRRPLDGGRIKALRRAGWTQKGIAEDLKTSPQCIANYIHRHKEEFADEA